MRDLDAERAMVNDQFFERESVQIDFMKVSMMTGSPLTPLGVPLMEPNLIFIPCLYCLALWGSVERP